MGRLPVDSDGVHVERSTEPGNRHSDRSRGEGEGSLGATVRSRDEPLALILSPSARKEAKTAGQCINLPTFLAVMPGKFAKLFFWTLILGN